MSLYNELFELFYEELLNTEHFDFIKDNYDKDNEDIEYLITSLTEGLFLLNKKDLNINDLIDYYVKYKFEYPLHIDNDKELIKEYELLTHKDKDKVFTIERYDFEE